MGDGWYAFNIAADWSLGRDNEAYIGKLVGEVVTASNHPDCRLTFTNMPPTWRVASDGACGNTLVGLFQPAELTADAD